MCVKLCKISRIHSQYLLKIIIFVFVFLPQLSNAQRSIQDLLNKLDSIQDSTKKASSLLFLSEYYLQSETEKSLDYAKQALIISEQLKDSTLICNAYRFLSIGEAQDFNCAESAALFRKGIQFANTSKDSAAFLSDMGAVFTICGNLQLARKCQTTAKELFLKIGDKGNLALLLVNMGVTYVRNSLYYQASSSYLEALALCQELNDEESIAVIYQNMGEVMALQEQYDKAVGYYTSSLNKFDELGKVRSMAGVYLNIGQIYIELEQWDVAKIYLNKSYVIDTTYNLENYESTALKQLGITYLRINKLKSAHELVRAALYIQNKNGYSTLIPETKSVFAEIYYQMDDLPKALELLKEAEKGAEKIGDDQLLSKVLLLQSTILGDINKYDEAYAKLQESTILSDSIFNLEKARSIMNLELAYQTEIKEKQIDELKYNDSLQQEQLKNKSIQVYLLIVSIILLFFFLLSMWVYWRKRRQIDNQKRERKFLQGRFEAEEKAKDEIARELHDDIGGQMIGMILQLQSTNKLKDKEIQQLQDIYQDVRRLSHSLDEPLFVEIKLQEKIRNYLSELKSQVKFESSFIDDFKEKWNHIEGSQELQRNIYRIIQELLTNTIKHAKATEVEIQLINESKSIVLMYEDNGKGMTSDDLDNNLNFNTIKKRLEMFDGHFEVNSQMDSGFLVIINIPYSLISNKNTNKK